MSKFQFVQLKDEEGRPYAIRHSDTDDEVLGYAWREGERWEAMVALTGERSGPLFGTREKAAKWCKGKRALLPGGKTEAQAAAMKIPDDPYEGLGGV